MSVNGDATEKMLGLGIDAGAAIAKLTALGAKNLAALLFALINELKTNSKEKCVGQVKIAKLLSAGKLPALFKLQEKDIKKFTAEAKKFAVPITIIKDKISNDGICDIVARESDVASINRIFEKLHFGTIDMDMPMEKELGENTPKKEKALVPPEKKSSEHEGMPTDSAEEKTYSKKSVKQKIEMFKDKGQSQNKAPGLAKTQTKNNKSK